MAWQVSLRRPGTGTMDLLISQLLVLVNIEFHLYAGDCVEVDLIVVVFYLDLFRCRDQRPRSLIDPVAH